MIPAALNEDKIEMVIVGVLSGLSRFIERLNFLPRICYHHPELKFFWMEKPKHILHKVSLTYILNEATPGCTS